MIVKPTKKSIQDAVQCIRDGQLIAFPTETVYGLAADVSNKQAVECVFQLKKRPLEKSLTIMIGDQSLISKYAFIIHPYEQKIIDTFMPGPITLLLKKKDTVPPYVSSNEFVGIRIPDHTVALDFLNAFDGGIVAPSANLSGELPAVSALEVEASFGAIVPLVLDGGVCQQGISSTVVKIDDGEIIVLREGSITRQDIQAIL